MSCANRSNDDFRKRGRDSKPSRNKDGYECKKEPETSTVSTAVLLLPL